MRHHTPLTLALTLALCLCAGVGWTWQPWIPQNLRLGSQWVGSSTGAAYYAKNSPVCFYELQGDDASLTPYVSGSKDATYAFGGEWDTDIYAPDADGTFRAWGGDRQQICLYSVDFSSADWLKSAGVTVNASTHTYVPDDGDTVIASTITFPVDESQFEYRTSPSSMMGSVFVCSAYVRTVSGTNDFIFQLRSDTEDEVADSKNINITTEWQRIVFTGVFDSTARPRLKFGIVNTPTNYDKTVIFGGVQIEEFPRWSDETNSTANYYDPTPSDYVATEGTAVDIPAEVPLGPDGLYVQGEATNYIPDESTLATQTTDSLDAGTYTLWVEGTGNATSSAGTATGSGFGTATEDSPNVITLTGNGTVTVTVAGTLTRLVLNNAGYKLYAPPTSGTAAVSGTMKANSTNGNSATLDAATIALFDSSGSFMAKLTPGYDEADGSGTVGLWTVNGTAASLLYTTHTTDLVMSDGTNTASVTWDWNADDELYVVCEWEGSEMRVGYSDDDGATITWGTAGTFDGAIPVGTELIPSWDNAYPWAYGFTRFGAKLTEAEYKQIITAREAALN